MAGVAAAGAVHREVAAASEADSAGAAAGVPAVSGVVVAAVSEGEAAADGTSCGAARVEDCLETTAAKCTRACFGGVLWG